MARLTRPAVTHWQFTVVLAAAILIRVIVILGYPPILWLSDSYTYIYDAFYYALFPALAIVLVMLLLNVIARSLQSATRAGVK